MKSFYLLVATDTETVDGDCRAGYEVARERLCRGLWALYRRTPNRERIKTGDEIVVYAAGSKRGGMCFVGSATVSQALVPGRPLENFDGNLLSDAPVRVIELKHVNLFDEPLSIREVRDELAFISQHKRWGVMLQGGCRRISSEDYEAIVRRGRHSVE